MNNVKNICAILVLYSGLLSCSDTSNDSQSAMFRGDVKHTGIYSTSGVKKFPGLKWKFKTDGYINSSAAIVGSNIYFGSGDGNLYCVNAVTGGLIWKFKTGGAVHSSPAIADGKVFFGSHDGNFYALDTKDGSLKWSFKTGGEKLFSAKGLHGALPKDSLFVDEWDFWLSSPAVQGNTVYFGSGDGKFYALNKDDGKEKWNFKTDGIIHSSPALAFGNVYFGGWDTYLHAVNAETGKEVWRFKTGTDTAIYNQTGITSSPVIDGNTLYFGCRDAHVYALDAQSGKFIWKKYNNGGWISATPLVSGDKVIYGSGSDEQFTALNKVNGDSIYQFKITSGAVAFSSPAVVDKTLYIGDLHGSMNARDVETGKSVWSFHLPNASEDTFHILNPNFSLNMDAFSAAIKKYQGKKTDLQILFSIGAILSSPVVKNGVIYFGATDGYFYALE